MKRTLIAIVLALVPVLALAQFDPAEHPNVEKGFSPEKMYQYSDIDSLNLFNGNVMLMIPIGGSYRVGPSLEYSIKLAYNAKMWDHTTGNGGPLALPVRTSNSGLGWQVSFGRVLTPQSPENDNFQYVYVDQSGLQHKMSYQLHKNDTKYDCTISGLACDPAGPLKVLYTTDNTYLRLTVKRDNTMTMATPDGTTMTFGTDGRLTRMEDPFHNWVNVATTFFSTGVPNSEIITDSRGRRHVVQYGLRTNSQRNYKSQIDTITMEAFETTATPHTTKATWTFHYTDTDVDRFRIPSSAPASNTVRVPLMDSLTLPAGAGKYEFDYFLHSTTGAGANNQMGCVRKMIYPTRGRLEWDYSLYANAVDTCGFALDLEATPGVRERRFYNDDTTTAATAVWTYNRVVQAYSDVSAGCGHFPANRLLPEYLANTVTRPDGGVEKYYFSAWPSLAAGRTNPSPRGSYGEEVGSPFKRFNVDTNVTCGLADRCLSVEIFANSNAASKKRSTFVRYENDLSDFRPTYPNSLNRRMQAQQTVYHDDGGVFTQTDHSNFDGFGHYRQSTSSANFDPATHKGDLRTSFTRYNPAVPPYPNVPAVTWSTAWLFTNRDQACVRDGDASAITDCLDAVGAAVTQFHMDDSGFTVKKRTLLGNQPAATDLLVLQSHDGDGFPTRERFFGGDRQTIDTNPDIVGLYANPADLPPVVYDLRHTYVAGTLATSRNYKPNGTAGSFLAVNHEIDPNTGLIKKTIDPSGITTSYTYDGLSRLATVSAAGLAPMTYGYNLQPGSGAKVSETSASTTGSIVSEYEFDGLGRMTRQTGSLEDGTRSSVRMAYDGMNRKISQTEPAVDGQPDGPASSMQYDVFNRLTLLTPPDGAAHNITMEYDGARTTRRKRFIGTSWSGSNVSETLVTDTETRDALGRFVSLQQPNNVTATYDYDLLDRMIHVRVDGPSGGAQDRSWEYDNRGFLIRELQPESNQTVFESFDARGHAWSTRTGSGSGAFAVDFQFDYAERLLQVKEGAGQHRFLKEFTYDSTSDAGHSYSAAGKLVKAIRHNWISLGGATAADTPVTRYVQYATNGRIGKQSTVVGARSFTQSFPYNDLGAPSQLSYPTCDDCGVAKGSRDIPVTYGFGHVTRVNSLTSASQLIDYWPNGMTKSLTHVGPGGTNPVVDSQTLANGMLRPGSISFSGIVDCATANTTITAPASVPASASGSASIPSTAGATYAWSVTGGTLTSPANGTSITFTAGCSGNVAVTVTATSSCGAVSSASKQVAISQPTAAVSGGGSIPPGGNATIQVLLTGVAPFRVTWSDNVVQTGQPSGTVTRTVSPTSSTTYTATATNAANCAAVSTGSAVVVVGSSCAAPSATITSASPIFAGATGTASLTPTANATYAWTITNGTITSSATGSNITYKAGCTGNVAINVTVTASCGTSASGSVSIATAPSTATVSGGGTAPATITATLTGAAPWVLTWSDGVTQTTSTSPATRSVSPSATTTYMLTAFTGAGCGGTFSGSATVSVSGRITPTITWPTPALIRYNTPLDATQLNATANVPGTFTYTPPAGTILELGNNTLSVLFVPNDTASYTNATASVTLFVAQALPSIFWPPPGAITYGTPLSSVQLNATADVPGTYAYTPAIGTVLGVGLNGLQLLFTPTDQTHYVTTQEVRQITVLKITPVITWPTPAAITYPTALSATQLNATSNVPGAFSYSPAAGTVLAAGSRTLTATFTPTDTAHYSNTGAVVTLTVQKATPAITWSAPAGITYPTPLGAAQLNATSSAPGTFVYTPPSGTILAAGAATLNVAFTPTDAANYNTAAASVPITVARAAQTIVWPAPANIATGTPISAAQLNATVTVPGPSPAGALTYDTPLGTVFTAGNHAMTATAAATSNYNLATKTVNIYVCAPPVITQQPASVTITTPASVTLLLQASSSTGTPPTITWYTSAGALVGTGAPSVSPTITTSYYAIVSDSCMGVRSANMTVTVCAPPAIITQPASTAITSGQTATLSVVASGSAPLTYRWFEGTSGVTTTQVGSSSSFTTPVLTATKSYWVQVTSTCNGVAIVNSVTATVTVNPVPAQITRRQSATATANSQRSIAANWTQPTQAGNLLVAVLSGTYGAGDPLDWTPPAGWVLSGTYAWNTITAAIYYLPNNGGGRTSETFNIVRGFHDQTLTLIEYSGVALTSPLDKTAFNGDFANSGFVDTGFTSTTVQPKEVVITLLTTDAQTSFSAPSNGFTEVSDLNMLFHLTTAVHERITTTAGSWGHSASVGSGAQWVGLVATFKSANPN